jgi:xylulokinase
MIPNPHGRNVISDAIFLLGLDLGISTVKAGLFTPAGEMLALESHEYLIIPDGDKVEVDPEHYWTPVVQSVRRLLAKWGGDPGKIAALSVSSHTETVIPMTREGKPARPALVWMDNRSQPEAEELRCEFGLQRVLQIGGQPDITPLWPVTKFRWLSKNEPDTVRRTGKFLLPEDYLLYRLSGRFAAEPSMWSSSLVLDISRRKWCDDLVKFGGIRTEQLPDLFPSGTAIGHISNACAEETGLSVKTAVVTGGLDHTCAGVAAGNIEPGVVTVSTGSVLALLTTIRKPVFDHSTPVPCHIHAAPDRYCLLPWNQTGGLAFKWFKDRFAEGFGVSNAAGTPSVYDALVAEAANVPPGSDGMVMLPHLEGALFPEFDPHARGVFFGITLAHKRAHFVRALLEAMAFQIRRDLEGLSRLGVQARELRVLGGGAKSRLGAEIKADICGIPVVIPAQQEAAVLGAAILAAVGVGLYPNLESAVKAMACGGEEVEPNPANRAVYDRAYKLYIALYDAVRALYPECAEIARAARERCIA